LQTKREREGIAKQWQREALRSGVSDGNSHCGVVYLFISGTLGLNSTCSQMLFVLKSNTVDILIIHNIIMHNSLNAWTLCWNQHGMQGDGMHIA
jgi:hypothetical protein